MSDLDKMPDVPINPLLSAMFMYEVHAYALRCVTSVSLLARSSSACAVEILETVGYQTTTEDQREVYSVIGQMMYRVEDGIAPDLPETVVKHDPRLADPMRLAEDDVRHGTTDRVLGLIGICLPDFDWDIEQTVAMIYRVFASLGYSVVQMRMLPVDRVADMARTAHHFDWRKGHVPE